MSYDPEQDCIFVGDDGKFDASFSVGDMTSRDESYGCFRLVIGEYVPPWVLTRLVATMIA